MSTPTRTPNFHFASMRCAELVANGMQDRIAAAPPVERPALREIQTSYYRLGHAHRNAAHRLERGARIRARVERIVRLVVRGALRVGRAVTA